MVLPFITAGLGIAQAVGGFAQGQSQAAAANRNAIEQYKHQLKIVQKQNTDQNQIYATKLGQYDFGMKAADRAAARAYGAEQYNQSQRIKKATSSSMALNRAIAKSGGAAVVSGRSGRSVDRLDANIEGDFVRNQATLAANLLAADEASSMNMLGMQDRLTSERNRLYSQVAIAPTQPILPQAPMMRSGPNPLGMMLNIGSSIVGAVGQAQNMEAPDPGDLPLTNNTTWNQVATEANSFFGANS